ncbi:MAG: ComEC/Rec2 family competence protein, partial [Pseudomonadota bacterium]
MRRIYANSGKEDKVRGVDNFRAMLEIEREGAMLWAPVALGTGVGIYFSLSFEPARLAVFGLGLLAAAGLWCARAGRVSLGLAAMALLGIVVSALQTERVRAPILSGELRGPVVGRVVAIDRSASNAHRVTLDRVHLPGRATVPERVRVSLAGPVADGVLEAGALVMMRAWLSRPNPPVEPGDFDFRRHAWFARIGAVGYTRDPVVLAAAQPVHDLGTRILALRLSLSRDIQARLPGAEGAFAAAILTGDRSAINPRDMAALRASNLAHLLAISGLHMGLLTGFVFASLRMVLAGVPALALRLPVKKVAAAAGILCGAVYLVLSGATVATERAFIMAAVALGAVLLDRPAITLRAVALAALIVLLRNPVSLLGPGFQMSFAATAGLVAVYGRLRRLRLRDWMRGRHWAPVRWVAALALTS